MGRPDRPESSGCADDSRQPNQNREEDGESGELAATEGQLAIDGGDLRGKGGERGFEPVEPFENGEAVLVPRWRHGGV